MMEGTDEQGTGEDGTGLIVVVGARGLFEREALLEHVRAVGGELDVVLQAFDPAAVYGREHLAAAARKAVRAHREDRAVARDLAAEIACYAAGTHQIDEALSTVGVPAEGQALVLLAMGEGAEQAVDAVLAQAGLDRDDEVIQAREATLDRLGIPPALRETVPQEDWPLLVLEQVALLDAEK